MCSTDIMLDFGPDHNSREDLVFWNADASFPSACPPEPSSPSFSHSHSASPSPSESPKGALPSHLPDASDSLLAAMVAQLAHAAQFPQAQLADLFLPNSSPGDSSKGSTGAWAVPVLSPVVLSSVSPKQKTD